MWIKHLHSDQDDNHKNMSLIKLIPSVSNQYPWYLPLVSVTMLEIGHNSRTTGESVYNIQTNIVLIKKLVSNSEKISTELKETQINNQIICHEQVRYGPVLIKLLRMTSRNCAVNTSTWDSDLRLIYEVSYSHCQ